jgi:hypothetical protein
MVASATREMLFCMSFLREVVTRITSVANIFICFITPSIFVVCLKHLFQVLRSIYATLPGKPDIPQ